MKKLYLLLVIAGILLAGGYLYTRMALQKKVKRLAAIQVMQSTDSLPAKPTMDLMPLLKTVLQQLVKKGSRGLYDLEFEDMEIDVLQSMVLLKNIKLDKNPQALNQLRST